MQQSIAIVVCTALLWSCTEAMRTKSGSAHTIDVMRNDEPAISQSPSTTVNGCTCKADSKCGATINGSFSCDWCRVEQDLNCGHRDSVFGAWDYCQYPTMQPYEAQSASEKMTQLWDKVTGADVVDKSGSVKSLLGVVTSIIGTSMRTPFDNHWDVLPEGRTKVIHSQGVHCQFELDVANASAFTGILGAGKQQGIIRMGSASSLDATGKPPFPGLSFKFLRSGVESGNFVALRTTGPDGGGYAFFDTPFSKIVNPPAALKALMKFEQASNCVSMVGLSDLCQYGQDGTAVPEEHLNFPYDILFEAASESVYLPDEKMTDEEMLNHLSQIPAGTQLFHVYTKASPTAVDKDYLGTLTTASKCVKSIFGDTSLFFRHQRMEEDFVHKPEWVDDITAPGCNAVAAPSSQWQCPGVH